MADILILGGARTPFTTWSGGKRGDGQEGGALKPLDPFDLGAAALRGGLDRCGVSPDAVDRLVFANVYHVGPHACYGGRYAALRAGLPETVPALTVNMACGAGLYAVIAAARELSCGGASLVAAVGADSSSRVPRAVLIPSFTDAACGQEIGRTVEDLAKAHAVGREDQDRWALESHRRAWRARERGLLADELVSAGGVAQDDAVLPDPAAERFASEKPSFGDGGTVTKANSHAVVDGGSALLLAVPEGASRARQAPLGRLVGGAFVGTAPARMGYASVPAIQRVLKDAKLKAADVDLFEINETFAAQLLIDLKELGIPEDKVNCNGGAIAFGHPFGGTGCRQVLSLLLELRRRKLKRGVASICVGGGQGVAVLVEAA